MFSTLRPFKRFARPLLCCGFILFLVPLCEAIAVGQIVTTTTSVTDGRTPAALQPGSPVGSYPLSGFDNVNLFNGNLGFRLPLLHVGGRGSAQMTINLALNLKSWHIKHTHKVMPDESEIDSFVPIQTGWMPYAGYGAGRLDGRNYGLQTSSNFTCRWYSTTLSRLTFSASDGTEYELRDQLTNGQPLSSTCTQGANRGTVFVTADGTAATFVSDTTIYDNPAVNAFGPHGFGVSGFLTLKDGTRYRIDNSDITWIRDRNGNKITFTYTSSSMTVTDQLNRTVTINYNVSDIAPYGLCDQIIYKGFGGAQRIIRISHTNLGSALRANSGYSIRTLGGASGLFPETNGSSSTNYDPTITSAVWLPDGIKSYKFYYNSYGELARVELPTGGAYEYDMTPGSGVLCNGTCWPGDDREIYRRLVERRIYSNGSSGSSFDRKEIYTNTETIGTDSETVTVEQIAATGTVLARSRHYFTGSALNSLFGGAVTIPYPTWWEGNETQTDILDTSGSLASATVLRSTVTTRANRTPVPWWPNMYQPSTKEPPNDKRVTSVVTTIEPATANLVSQQTFGYDDSVPFNNQNNVKEYGFGNGSPGGLLRETRTTYLTSATYTGTNVHVRNLQTQVSVYDGGGTERARSAIEYDNYNFDSYHAGLVARTNISGFDSAFTTSYTTRGNATSSTGYFLVNGSVTGSFSSYAQYDIAGNTVKVIDARSTPSNIIASIIEYDDRYGVPDNEARANTAPGELAGLTSFAFPTKVRNPLDHATYTQFDYYLGQPINGEDANGSVAAGYFNDLLDRPTQVRRAVGTTIENQTTFTYDDTTRTITTSSDRDTNGDNVVVGKIVYDKLGRSIESRQYEGGSNYIVTETQYDALGRSYKTSNPYRPWQSQTAVWTTQLFDALGRVISVTTPDNAIVSTSYSANTLTVTDQAGKARKSVTDALGRLVEVYEDPAGSNYQTSYSYDVLDDLTGVSQGLQTRTFVYDSLKRLTGATNPESGTVSYGYDANGNLTSKTDARSITTTYIYDGLDRLTTRSYSDGTPTVTYTYDSASVTNSKGRLTSVSSSVSSTNYTAYDALGRITAANQVTDGQTYVMSYGYNLAGGRTSMTYPSGRVITTGYDEAGRLAGVRDQSSGIYYAGGASTDTTNRVQYAAHGAVSVMKLGNGLWEHTNFNTRLQPTEIGLGTSGISTSVVGLTYNYGTTNNNSNVLSVSYAGGGLNYTQSFGYDPLNRLTSASESGSAWSQTNAYDRYGNRQIDYGGGNYNLTFSSSTNRITTSGYSYDSAGNLTNDPVHSYGFDAENKIKSVDGVSDVYRYDGDGNRVRKNFTSGDKLRLVYSDGRLIAEYDLSNGSLKKEYIYSAKGLLATVEPTIGTRYTTSDSLSSPRVVTDSSAGVVSRHDYLPFGEEIGAGVGGRTTGMGFNAIDGLRQKFTRYERDTETGLDYAGARYHSPTQGRFTSIDPVMVSARPTNPQGWNRYSYVLNRPTSLVDPSGAISERPSHINQEEQEYDTRLQSTRNAVEATEAANNGDWDTYNEIMAADSNLVPSQETVDATRDLVQVVIWTKPTKGLKDLNPVYAFGHVSFVIGDKAYSWQAHIDPQTGQEDWYIAPAADYIRDKQKDGSHGTGYYLDFGSKEANEKFKNLLLDAYNQFAPDGNRWGYSITQNNCGDAFKRAINKMGIPGLPKENSIKPSSHQWFIENVLGPKKYIRSMVQY
ncbi:MAG TPA: RHS repeat-associated core domain-containing protein [Pyrinomonadaceae bacterium]|nr:RHS repeat-associated core domain-containing protein [Pyrinomonadaceae bacterium]